MLTVLARQPVEAQRLLDIFLNPGNEPGILGLQFPDPGSKAWRASTKSRRS
jgi:hypothetical protein